MVETMNELSPEDQSLVEEAQAIIRKRFKEGAHHIGSALRTKSGRVFVGVNLEAYIGRVAVCAEAIAIGHAATAGNTDIDTIVAVTEDGRVVPPCGICREFDFRLWSGSEHNHRERQGIASCSRVRVTPSKISKINLPTRHWR